MRQLLAAVVFAAAATGSTLAGSGLVVAPHLDPPGTPVAHDHVLAAYRFPLYLMRLQERSFKGERFSLEAPLAGGTAALVLAFLVFRAPRLPRPTRRVIAFVPGPADREAQWRPVLPLAPPRANALRTVA